MNKVHKKTQDHVRHTANIKQSVQIVCWHGRRLTNQINKQFQIPSFSCHPHLVIYIVLRKGTPMVSGNDHLREGEKTCPVLEEGSIVYEVQLWHYAAVELGGRTYLVLMTTGMCIMLASSICATSWSPGGVFVDYTSRMMMQNTSCVICEFHGPPPSAYMN